MLFMTYPVIGTDPQLFIDRQGNFREVMADEMANIAQNVRQRTAKFGNVSALHANCRLICAHC